MSKHTQGDWQVFNMIHAERHERMTPDEIGEYVANSVRKTLSEGGSNDFLFVSTGEGAPDICHVGNGPAGPANARLIVRAVNNHDALLEALAGLIAAVERDASDPAKGLSGYTGARLTDARAALAAAKGE